MTPDEWMLKYLQGMLTSLQAEEEQFGREDRIVVKKMLSLLACKEMVEAYLGAPVNLGLDGKVTVG